MSEIVAENIAPNEAIAIVSGKVFSDIPEDLYIPPDALRVLLEETFEGPLDLLLYLIRRHNLDILDIPIAAITHQYMSYIDIIQNMRLELAADYLVMAATLAEIKSRMLLPRPESTEEVEEDPRAELIRRLQEYECFKKSAEELDEIPRYGREIHWAKTQTPDLSLEKPLPEVELKELLLAFSDVLKRSKLTEHHHIQKEPLSVRERMSQVLDRLQGSNGFIEFPRLFNYNEGRIGLVVTFIAMLELIRNGLIELVQTEPFSPIHIKAVMA